MTTKFAGLMTPSTPSGPMGGVRPPPAPGLRGKGSTSMGMAPRQAFAPMNTMAPMGPPAGSMEQKSIEPPSPRMQAPQVPAPMMKMNSVRGNEVSMATTMAARPLRLQDMLKTAMAESSRRVSVGLEAARQINAPIEEEKTASVTESSGSVDSEYALKLASAIEYIAADFGKEAEEHQPGPGTGPGALHVMQAESSEQFPAHQGQGHHTVPMHTGLQAAHQSGGAKTQVPNDQDRAPGGPGHQTTAMSGGKGKTAGALLRDAFNKVAGEDAKLEKQETEGMSQVAKGLAKAEAAHAKEDGEEKKASSFARAARELQTKLAEDAINPARISAGAAVPPDTSASGEAGGAPVAGMPQGPRGLVHSNESAINYKRNQAYGGRKAELSQYFSEPALTQSTDKTLSAAFDHTSQAGTKFASASGGSTKVAAARTILLKLAEEAEASVKDKGEKSEKGNGRGASL